MYIHTETKTTHRVEACDLDRELKKIYGGDPNIAYHIMEDQQLYEVEVCGPAGEAELDEADQAYYDRIISQYKSGQIHFDSEVLEAMLSDMCVKGLIPAGDYIIEFND